VISGEHVSKPELECCPEETTGVETAGEHVSESDITCMIWDAPLKPDRSASMSNVGVEKSVLAIAIALRISPPGEANLST
jgi:hypothetical protein